MRYMVTQTYNVTFDIDIDAETPRAAAEQAAEYMLAGEYARRGVFTVVGEGGETTSVDLGDDEDL